MTSFTPIDWVEILKMGFKSDFTAENLVRVNWVAGFHGKIVDIEINYKNKSSKIVVFGSWFAREASKYYVKSRKKSVRIDSYRNAIIDNYPEASHGVEYKNTEILFF